VAPRRRHPEQPGISAATWGATSKNSRAGDGLVLIVVGRPLEEVNQPGIWNQCCSHDQGSISSRGPAGISAERDVDSASI
jgi:hypothetical protein